MAYKEIAHIFRAYDIRGIYGKDLTVETMQRLGSSFGQYMKNHGISVITVGGDIRASTSILQLAFVVGARAVGIDVDLVEQSPLGITLFNSFHKGLGASSFITASHLPPEWNGVKYYWGEGIGFSPEENQEVQEIFTKGNFTYVGAFDVGKLVQVDPYPDFLAYLKEKFQFKKQFKIAIDSGNGATALVMPRLYEDLGFQVIPLFDNPDPRFPNRSSEPTEESLSQLSTLVKQNQVDFAAGFDGDGDRCVIVDEKGKVLSADSFGLIISEYLIATRKNHTFIINMECSLAMERHLLNLGASVKRIRVGHSFLSLEAKEIGAVFGIESSGHAILPEVFLFDDALVLPLIFAKAVEHFNQPTSVLNDRIVLPLKRRIDLKCDDNLKFQVVEKIIIEFKKLEGEVNDLDGVALTTTEGRVLVRVSNTSPKVRVTIEADNEEKFETLRSRYLPIVENQITNN